MPRCPPEPQASVAKSRNLEGTARASAAEASLLGSRVKRRPDNRHICHFRRRLPARASIILAGSQPPSPLLRIAAPGRTRTILIQRREARLQVADQSRCIATTPFIDTAPIGRYSTSSISRTVTYVRRIWTASSTTIDNVIFIDTLPRLSIAAITKIHWHHRPCRCGAR